MEPKEPREWFEPNGWYKGDGRPAGWFAPAEGEAYANLVGMLSNCVIAEIGIYNGRSLSYILPVCRQNNIRVMAIDNWSQSSSTEQQFFDWLESSGYADIVDVHSLSSKEVVQTVDDGSLELVMIDGSHMIEDVRHDIEAWLPKLSKHGIICGHDYLGDGIWEGVVKTVDELLGKPTYNLVHTFWWFQV